MKMHGFFRTLKLTATIMLVPSYVLAEQLVPIAVLAELSGPNAANGEDCKRGIEVALATQSPKSRQYRLIYADHQGEAKVAVSEFRRLIDQEQVWATIVTRSQTAMPLNSISANSTTPLLGVVGHPEFTSQNPFALRFYPVTSIEGKVLADAAYQRGMRRVATLSAEDAWTVSLAQSFHAHFVQLGGEVIREESALSDSQDLAGSLGILTRAAPDALFLNLTIAQAGQAIKQIRQLRFEKPVLTNFWGVHKNTVATAGTQNMEDIIFVEADLRFPRFMAALSESASTYSPTAVTYSCYAALNLVAQALSEGKAAESKSQLWNALRKDRSLHLLDGSAAVVNRELIVPVAAKQIREGIPQYLDAR
jgi:branched-chain amino acid transport system substrate-binding protein